MLNEAEEYPPKSARLWMVESRLEIKPTNNPIYNHYVNAGPFHITNMNFFLTMYFSTEKCIWKKKKKPNSKLVNIKMRYSMLQNK